MRNYRTSPDRLTSPRPATSNEDVIDRARDPDGDVIEAGRGKPRGGSPRPGGLIWLLVLVETAALAVSIAVALHYRTEAGEPHRTSPASPANRASSSSPVPQVTTVALSLPAAGGVTGTVVITAAALPGSGRAQFTVSAVITGALPGTYYNLIGNDCSAADPLVPDDVWAMGFTGANGTADLTGYAWTGGVTDSFWLALDPSPASRPPGLHGQFTAGQATPYPAGHPPCPR
jgi:hypothetical protein